MLLTDKTFRIVSIPSTFPRASLFSLLSSKIGMISAAYPRFPSWVLTDIRLRSHGKMVVFETSRTSCEGRLTQEIKDALPICFFFLVETRQIIYQ